MYLSQCFLVSFVFVEIIGIPLNSPLPNLSSYSEWLLTLSDPLVNHPRSFEYEDKAYTVSTFKARFFEAYHYCQYYNMGLVSVSSKEESSAIHASLKKLGYKYERFWTSGSRLADGVHWVWMSTGKPVEYTYWGQHEPSGGDETCIELRKRYDLILWNDVDCFHGDLHLYFICERQKTNETTPKCGKSDILPPPGSIPRFQFQTPWDNTTKNEDDSEEVEYGTSRPTNTNLKPESLTLESNNESRKCGQGNRQKLSGSGETPREKDGRQTFNSEKPGALTITIMNRKTNKKCVKSFSISHRRNLDIFINLNANKRKYQND